MVKGIYMRHVNGMVRKVPGKILAASMAAQGWSECGPPPEEPKKRSRRRKDYYYTPNFQGW